MHEADLADERYDAPEAPGLDVLLRGLSMVRDDDELLALSRAAVRRALRVPQARACSGGSRRDADLGLDRLRSVVSGLAAAVAVRFLLRERRPASWRGRVAAAAGPLAWNVILRHTGGDFFVDAPVAVFPISLQDTGSGVFATALSALLLGFGPLRAATGRRLALVTTVCGLAASLVDIYLY